MTTSFLDLPGVPQDFRVLFFEELDSTNDVARQQAQDGAAHGTVVLARRQTAGRGRHGRQWRSEEGNLFCSLVLYPDCHCTEAANLGFVAALAVRDSLSLLSGQSVHPRLKWPNDVLISGKKVCGLLLESFLQGAGKTGAVILGVGVNLCHAPSETNYPATSLAAAGGGQVFPEQALVAFLTTFDQWYRCWKKDGFGSIRAHWLTQAQGRGQKIRVRLPHDDVVGIFEDLDESGALVLSSESGTRLIHAGDVFPVSEAKI